MWSAENFFRVWTYMRGYVEYERSSDLGKYYMKHMFLGLACEVTVWLRHNLKSEADGRAMRQDLHDFYFAMPKKEVFADVDKSCFHEIFAHHRNQKRAKKRNHDAEQRAFERFVINEAPPSPP
ncbi:hypothetical protein F4861DRAFT_544562 [Xylaria intraflava]|nr:hypothetical protein F4861DRAFT_544562 [Xylaria intraflava]